MRLKGRGGHRQKGQAKVTPARQNKKESQDPRIGPVEEDVQKNEINKPISQGGAAAGWKKGDRFWGRGTNRVKNLCKKIQTTISGALRPAGKMQMDHH